MRENRYLAALEGSRCFLKLEGRLTYQICAPFDSFCCALTENSLVTEVIVDLCDAEYLDSTNLGILAGLAEYQLRKSGTKPCVCISGGDLRTILESMGLEEIMKLNETPASGPSIPYREIQAVSEVRRNLSSLMYASHKTLSDLNERNRNSFASLLDLLGKEV